MRVDLKSLLCHLCMRSDAIVMHIQEYCIKGQKRVTQCSCAYFVLGSEQYYNLPNVIIANWVKRA